MTSALTDGTGIATTPAMVSEGKIDKLSDVTKIGSINASDLDIVKTKTITVEVDKDGKITLSGEGLKKSTSSSTEDSTNIG